MTTNKVQHFQEWLVSFKKKPVIIPVSKLPKLEDYNKPHAYGMDFGSDSDFTTVVEFEKIGDVYYVLNVKTEDYENKSVVYQFTDKSVKAQSAIVDWIFKVVKN